MVTYLNTCTFNFRTLYPKIMTERSRDSSSYRWRRYCRRYALLSSRQAFNTYTNARKFQGHKQRYRHMAYLWHSIQKYLSRLILKLKASFQTGINVLNSSLDAQHSHRRGLPHQARDRQRREWAELDSDLGEPTCADTQQVWLFHFIRYKMK